MSEMSKAYPDASRADHEFMRYLFDGIESELSRFAEESAQVHCIQFTVELEAERKRLLALEAIDD